MLYNTPSAVILGHIFFYFHFYSNFKKFSLLKSGSNTETVSLFQLCKKFAIEISDSSLGGIPYKRERAICFTANRKVVSCGAPTVHEIPRPIYFSGPFQIENAVNLRVVDLNQFLNPMSFLNPMLVD